MGKKLIKSAIILLLCFSLSFLTAQEKEVPSADSLFKDGKSAYDAKDYEEAGQKLKTLMENYPNYEKRHKAMFLLGVSLKNTGNFANALSYLNPYDLENPMGEDEKEVLYNIGKCNEGLGRFDEAVKYYNKLIKLFPTDSRVQSLERYIGELQEVVMRKYEEANASYKAYIAKYPKSPDIMAVARRIPRIYEYVLGDYKKAAMEYKSFLTTYLKSEYSQSISFHLAELYEKERDYKSAVDQYKLVARNYAKTINGVTAHLRIAGIYENNLKSPEDAINAYKEYLKNYAEVYKKNPSSPDVAFRVGELYQGLKKYELAAEEFNKCILQYPSLYFDSKRMNTVTESLLNQNKAQDAINVYTKASEITPETNRKAEYKFQIARINHLVLKELAGALQIYEGISKDYPGTIWDMKARIESAKIYVRLNEQDKAVESYKEIIRNFFTEPKETVSAILQLASVLEKNNKFADAMKLYAGLVKKYSGMPEFSADVKTAYEKLDKLTSGESDMKFLTEIYEGIAKSSEPYAMQATNKLIELYSARPDETVLELLVKYNDILYLTKPGDEERYKAKEYSEGIVKMMGGTYSPVKGPEATFGRGVCRHNMAEYKDALPEYMNFLKASPSSKYASTARRMIARCNESMKAEENAIQKYKEVSRSHPNTPDAAMAQYRAGQLYEDKKEFKKAGDEYLAVSRVAPKDELAVKGLKRAISMYAEARDYDGAANACKDFADKYPNNDESYEVLYYSVDLQDRNNKPNLAVENLRKYVQLCQTSNLSGLKNKALFAKYRMATILEDKLKDYPGALESYNDFVKSLKNPIDGYDAYIKIAGLYERLSNVDEAIKSYNVLSANLPKEDARSIDVKFKLGSMLERRGKDEEAVKLYGEVMSIDAENPLATEALKNLYGYYNSKGMYDKAIEVCRNYVVSLKEGWSKNKVSAFLKLAEALEKKNDYDGASKIYYSLLYETDESVIAEKQRIWEGFRNCSDNGEFSNYVAKFDALYKDFVGSDVSRMALARMGEMYERKKEDGEALIIYSKLVSGSPNSKETKDLLDGRLYRTKYEWFEFLDKIRKGTLEDELGDIAGEKDRKLREKQKKMREEIDVLLKKDKPQPQDYHRVAEIYEELKELASAAKYYEKAQYGIPEDLYKAGICWYKLKQYERAYELFRLGKDTIKILAGKGLKIPPEFAMAIGKHYIKTGEWENANAFYKSYPEKYPNANEELVAEAELMIGEILLGQKKEKEAIDQFESVAKKYPKAQATFDAQIRLGEYLYGEAKFEQALDLLEPLIEKATDEKAALAEFLVGKIYYDRAEFDRALEHYQQLLLKYPNEPKANYAYFALGGESVRRGDFLTSLDLYELIGMNTGDVKTTFPIERVIFLRLSDKDLNLIGTDRVAVKVTTSVGKDEEVMLLDQGEVKTGVFTGRIRTINEKVAKNDEVLQTWGSDVVSILYVDKYNDIGETNVTVIDTLVSATDGTVEMRTTEFPDMEPEEELEMIRKRQLEYKEERKVVKPGNNVYVRVRDPDLDVSDEMDTAVAYTVTKTGERAYVILTETRPHSKRFVGVAKTGEKPPEAYASQSYLFCEPKFAIDGDKSAQTVWKTDPMSSQNQWIAVDLKRTSKIKKILWDRGEKATENFPADYAVEVSDDDYNKDGKGSWDKVKEIVGNANPNDNAIELDSPAEARFVRLKVSKANGKNVEISNIEIYDDNGVKLVPVAGKTGLGLSNVLYVGTGDMVRALYDDASNEKGRDIVHNYTEEIKVSYTDGEVDFARWDPQQDRRNSSPETVYRIIIGDNILVRVTDWDLDATERLDKAVVIVETNYPDREILELMETKNTSGEFVAPVVVKKEASKNNDGVISIKDGGDLKIRYTDSENVEPGYTLTREFKASENSPTEATVEISAESPVGDEIKRIPINKPIKVRVKDPDKGIYESSVINVTLTTSSKITQTMELELAEPDTGVFEGTLNLALGDKTSIAESILSVGTSAKPSKKKKRRADQMVEKIKLLNVSGGDKIVATYVDEVAPGGKTNVEKTDITSLAADGDVRFTASNYEDSPPIIAAGDTIYIVVNDPDKDVSDKNDTVFATVRAVLGDKVECMLFETLPHSGIFAYAVPTSASEGDMNNQVLETGLEDNIELLYTDEYNIAPGSVTLRTANLLMLGGTEGLLSIMMKRFEDEEFEIKTLYYLGNTHYMLGKEFLAMKEEELAGENFGKAHKIVANLVERFPFNKYLDKIYALSGDVYLEQTEYDKAIDWYTKVVEDFPSSEMAAYSTYKIGQCYEDRDMFDEAVDAYATLVYLYKDDSRVSNSMIRISDYMFKRKMYPQAEIVYKKIVEKFPKHPLVEKLAFRVGLCLYLQEKFGEAAETFEEFLKKYTDSDLGPDAYYWAADCYSKLNDTKRAYRMFKKLTWDYPDSKPAKHARKKLEQEFKYFKDDNE